MIERLLLDRVNAVAAGAPVGRQDDGVTLAHAHEAEPALPLVQAAGPRAHIALDPPVLGEVPVPRRHRGTAHRSPSNLPPSWRYGDEVGSGAVQAELSSSASPPARCRASRSGSRSATNTFWSM